MSIGEGKLPIRRPNIGSQAYVDEMLAADSLSTEVFFFGHFK